MFEFRVVLLFLLVVSCCSFLSSPRQGFLNGLQASNKSKVFSNRSKLEPFQNVSPVAQSNLSSPYPCSPRELDLRIARLLFPAVLHFSTVPLIRSIDLSWVGKLRDAPAMAGQGAAEQIFSSGFWILSFLPNVLTPEIARASGLNDKNLIKEKISEAVVLGSVVGFAGMILMSVFTNFILSTVLPHTSETIKINYAFPYLKIRGLSFIPALISTIGFASFKGSMDLVTPLQISVISSVIGMLFNPVLIFYLKLGVRGSAYATLISDFISCFLYLYLLHRRGMVDLMHIFSFLSSNNSSNPNFNSNSTSEETTIPIQKPTSFLSENLKSFIVKGLLIQMRAISLNLALLVITRRVQSLDSTGVAAAAHSVTMQCWYLTGTFLIAMSSVAASLLPNQFAKAKSHALARHKFLNENNTSLSGISSTVSGEDDASLVFRESLIVGKFTADRLLLWGAVMGISMCFLQLMCLPFLKFFTPLESIQNAAKVPSIMAAVVQCINGIVFVGEGIQQGNQRYASLAVQMFLATAGTIVSLHFVGSSLVGVWFSLGVFNFIRFIGVLRHHFITGPFSQTQIEKNKNV